VGHPIMISCGKITGIGDNPRLSYNSLSPAPFERLSLCIEGDRRRGEREMFVDNQKMTEGGQLGSLGGHVVSNIRF
jgi:hypothetical protein